MNPDKSKFTNPLAEQRSIDIEFQVKHILKEILRNKPLEIEEVHTELIDEIASKSGASKKTVEKVIKNILEKKNHILFLKNNLVNILKVVGILQHNLKNLLRKSLENSHMMLSWLEKKGNHQN